MNIMKKLPVKKSPMHSSLARFNKHANGSAQPRDENNRSALNKKSKEKMQKQPSSTLLKPMQQTAKRSYLTSQNARSTVPEIEFSLVDSKEDYKTKYYNTLRELELGDSHKIGKCFSHKQFATEGEYRNEELAHSSVGVTKMAKVLKCHLHPVKDAKYLVELNQDEDILCCIDCATTFAAKGCHLEEISALRSKRNYELDELLQKSLQSMQTLRKCLAHLPEHYHSLLTELKQQMDCHDNYYNKLLDLLARKKDQTQKLLMNSLNELTDRFNKLHKDLHSQLSDLQANYNKIIVNRQEIKKMQEDDFTRIMKTYQSKLIIPQCALNPEVEVWKVETGDVSQFEKDVEKYLVKIEEEEAKTLNQSTVEIRPEEEEEDGLLCEEEFEWGYKPPKPAGPSKDIYFSFQKKQSEQSVSSPAFKQI